MLVDNLSFSLIGLVISLIIWATLYPLLSSPTLLLLLHRDDPKGTADKDCTRQDIDTGRQEKMPAKENRQCLCSKCPEMPDPEEQVCCRSESKWQREYNSKGR